MRLSGFDERYAPAYCEDSDIAFRLREHGYKVLYQPRSQVVHFEGVSTAVITQRRPEVLPGTQPANLSGALAAGPVASDICRTANTSCARATAHVDATSSW